jgi:hypothetical protein
MTSKIPPTYSTYLPDEGFAESICLTTEDITDSLEILIQKKFAGKPVMYNEVTYEFLALFDKQISLIGEERPSSRVDELNKKLALVAKQVDSVVQNDLFKGQGVPLVSKGCYTPAQLGYNALQKKVARGNLNIGIYQIRGDGHCLFRAIACGLFLAYDKAPQDKKDAFLMHFMNLANQNPESKEQFKTIGKYMRTGRGWHDLMSDEQSSNAIVFALRKIACQYFKNHHDEYDEEQIKAHFKPSFDTYIKNMETSSEGGQGEIDALATMLGIGIVHYDTSTEHDMEFQPQDKRRILPGFCGLIFSPGHYDFATIL